RLLGRPAAEALGQPAERAVALTDRPDWFARAIRDAKDTAEIVFEASQPDGRELEVTIAPIGTHGLPGVSEDWSVVLRDVTRRKHAERRLKVILGEMRHRMKNTLGVVAGLARQTLPQSHAEGFVSRLQALSAAHDALGEEGAEDMPSGAAAADLRMLIDTAARTAGDPARFEIDGPEVRLTARQATSLSMALHELVTNALKYGALSCETGRVRIDYGLEEATGRLSLHWRERGGPPVVPPTRRGFGTKMIGMVLKAELGGEIDFEFAPEGFCFEMVFPTR
ncbi:sensor histidine kinase, partial [Limimaricola sp. ASW11-118]